MTENIHLLKHALLRHKISQLRNKDTSTAVFRCLIEEIAFIIGVESSRDLKLKEFTVQSPIDITTGYCLERDVCLVPIFRAGLGMVNGLLQLFPDATIASIGLCRNEQTLAPELYYEKLPSEMINQDVWILDPMLATGGSASAAITILKNRGVHNIRLLNIVASPEGIAFITRNHPDVEVFIGALDDRLNSHGYIVPGLGDVGDRIFGTN